MQPMQGLNLQADESRRMLKPANIVKWYREIAGLAPSTPLPPNVTYSEMLKTVLEYDATSALDARTKQSVA
jgi:hypothetical protein